MYDDDKITPPDGLEEALAAALVQASLVPNSGMAIHAEKVLYSSAMQTWLRQQYADRATAAEAPREDREPLQVVCQVVVPLRSPHAAADALSRVPINASVKYVEGTGLIEGLLGVRSLMATWTEER
jgi:hypothetical protein